MSGKVRHGDPFQEIARQITGSYQTIGTINHLGHSPLPGTNEVIGIAQDVKEIIFPGYRRRQNLTRSNVSVHVRELLDRIHERLVCQIDRALRHRHQLRGQSSASEPDHFTAEAQRTALTFQDTLPRMRETLASDVQAAFDGDPAARSRDEIIFCYPGVEAITIHRIAHALWQLDVPVIPRVLAEWAHRETGIDIHPGATVGGSFFVDHGTGVVIGETCEIGSHVTLYQGVTLGAWTFPRDASGKLIRGRKRHPTLEDNVVIYSNASVLGGDTVVGANSSIGAGVSLNRSVPPNTVVTVERPSLRFRDAA